MSTYTYVYVYVYASVCARTNVYMYVIVCMCVPVYKCIRYTGMYTCLYAVCMHAGKGGLQFWPIYICFQWETLWSHISNPMISWQVISSDSDMRGREAVSSAKWQWSAHRLVAQSRHLNNKQAQGKWARQYPPTPDTWQDLGSTLDLSNPLLTLGYHWSFKWRGKSNDQRTRRLTDCIHREWYLKNASMYP